MKVLVYFKPKENFDNFEGTRLRKSIKGALEVSNIQYAVNEDDEYDIAQFISANDELVINRCLDKNIPVVVAALYGESDPSSSFLVYKNKKTGKRIELSQKGLRVLNKADLVIVPNELSKKFLQDSGVTKDIKIVPPFINISRFNASRNDEKEIFYKYFREDKDKQLVICLGSSNNIDGINAFISSAKKFPNDVFYYFVQDNPKISFKIKHATYKATKNLHYVKIPSDDIYRSALLNASVLMYAGYDAVGLVSIYEAMAAKCELVIREQSLFNDILIDGHNCHAGKYSETISSILKDCLSGKIPSTKEEAFKIAANSGLDVLGNELKSIYKKVINSKRR